MTTRRIGSGIREREKRTIRQALPTAGLGLFTERGLAATTAVKIAAAPGGWERTCFGGLACKADLLLGDPLELLLASLGAARKAHPAGQPPLLAVPEAVRSLGPQTGATLLKARRRRNAHPSWGPGRFR